MMQDMFLYIRNESWQGTNPLHPFNQIITKLKMARPRKTDGQLRKIMRLIRLTESEDQLLVERADAAGMNLSDFIRAICLNRKFIPHPRLGDAELLVFIRGEIGRTGNNLQNLIISLRDTQTASTILEAKTVIEQLQEVNTEVLNMLRHGHSGKK
ncbi:plasmid mobilization protein [Dyadobacter sp. CY323]|uniref:plasmid mobilization protein n=1 Tax=Dyadobacter sp. CY323 TaxID=2907302 RepID=UPI001F2B9794|nr:hypothetical protein [Dyadobacter sp. CY323]MCE6989017.1 hypothetical protein [Dyadobacter sp. CY323]